MSDAVDQQKALTDEDVKPKTKTEKEHDKALEDYSQVEDNGKTSMKVKVHSPFKDYYDGQAFSVSAENATGPFDILAHHHNFISLLLPCEVVVRTVKDGDRKIRISGGIMHVKADQVIIFLDV
jgi:hypothetical protein